MKRALSLAAMVAMLVASLVAAEANPLSFVTSIPLGARARDVILEVGRLCGASPCDVAYVATDLGLSVVDITGRDAPREIGKIRLGAPSWGLARQGHLVFMANSKRGLRVIDVSDATAPVEVGAMAIPGSGGARDVAVKDDVVYVARFSGEVWAIRHSPAPNPPRVALTLLTRIGLPAWGQQRPHGPAP